MALLARHWRTAVLVYGAFAAAMTAFEVWATNSFPPDNPDALFAGGESLAIIVVSLLGIPVSYHLTEHVMVREGLCIPGQPHRYGAMLGASILAGLGTMIGLLFLIVPGLILMARWSIWAPLIVAQGRGAGDSLEASWDATSRSQSGLATIWLVLAVGLISLAVAIGVATGTFAELPLPPSYGWNFVQGILLEQMQAQILAVLTLFISIAAFRLLVGSTSELDNVFA